MAIMLGLLAAACWGIGDFLAQVSGRGVGLQRSLFYSQWLGTAVISVWLLSSPAAWDPLRQPSLAALAAALAAAGIGFIATLALYRGLQVGRVGLVSPIVGAYGAVAAVLSLATGETLSRVAVAGIMVVAAGSALVAAPSQAKADRGRAVPDQSAGLGWAALACVGYGAQFGIQGRFAVPALGPVAPVWIYYLCSALAWTAIAMVRRAPLAVRGRQAGTVLGAGAFGVLGFLALSAGFATGNVAVVSVLSSLQAAIAVGLACLLVRERLGLRQWFGVGAVVAGLGVMQVA